MNKFIEMLNEEQLDLLNKIRPDFKEIDIEDLDEWLTYYFQEQGLEDIDSNPEQLILESILDILGEL